MAVHSVHASPAQDPVWRRGVLPLHHAPGQPVGLAVCPGSPGPPPHQRVRGPGAAGPDPGPLHHLHLLDHGRVPAAGSDCVLQNVPQMCFKCPKWFSIT